MSGKSRRRSGRPSRTGRRSDDPRLPSQSHLPSTAGRAKRETTFGVVGQDGEVDLDGVDAPVERPRRRTAARTTSPQAAGVKRSSLRATDPDRRSRRAPPPSPYPDDLPDFLVAGSESPELDEAGNPLRRTPLNRQVSRDSDDSQPRVPPRRRSNAPPPPRRKSAQEAFDPMAADADDGAGNDENAALLEAVSRDFRKPQLSATLHGPLSDKARRRSSPRHDAVVLPGDSDVLPLAEPPPADTAPKAVQQLRSPDAQARLEANDGPLLPAVGAHQWLDYRFVALAGLALAVTSLFMPASGGASIALWEIFTAPLPGMWTAGLMIAAGGLVGAIATIAMAWSRQDLVPDTVEDMPASGYLLLAGLFASVALVFRGAADPSLLMPVTAPLRGALLGVPAMLWAAVCAGGLLQLADERRTRAGRMLAGLGALGLFCLCFMPVGWLGSATVPFFAAFSASEDLSLLQGKQLTEVVMAGPGLAVLQGAVAVSAVGILAIPRRLPRAVHWAVAALVLLVFSLDPMWLKTTDAAAMLGACAMNLGLGVILSVVTALALDRLFIPGAIDTRNEIESMALLAVIGAFVLAKINGLRYSATDEAIYHYAAKAWSDGVWPYHDFFFSHPPLHIGLPALGYALIGYSFTLTKWLSVAATLVTGVAIWRIGRAHIDPIAGVLAMGLFLFASETLKASTNLTGINLTTMWSMLGLWAALSGRGFVAGLLLGAAACTGVYAAGVALALVILSAFAPRPPGASSLIGRVLSAPATQLVFGFAIVFVTINAVFNLMAGDAYYDGVYRYHFLKSAKTPGFEPMSDGLGAILGNLKRMLTGRDFTISTYYHGAQFWLALLAPIGVALGVVAQRLLLGAVPHELAKSSKKSGDRRAGGPDDTMNPRSWMMLVSPRRWWIHREAGGAVMLVWCVAWALLAEFAQFKERYDFYYTLLLPVVSLLAASWLSAMLRMGRIAIGAGKQWLAPRTESPIAAAEFAPSWTRVTAAAMVFATFLWVPVNIWANRAAWPSEYERKGADGNVVQTVGERLTFDWTDAPGPAFFSDATRAMLWQPHRLRGNVESGLHHYLWSKKRHFSVAEEIADFIRANSEPDETIIGSSTHAPLIALLADRRLAADWVDTNTKVFKTGIRTRRHFWDKVCSDNVRYIIAGPMSFFSPRVMHRKPTVARNFRLVKEWSDPHLKHWRTVTIQLWERKSHEPGWRCQYYGAIADGGA